MKARKAISMACLGLVLIGTVTVAFAGNANSARQLLVNAFKTMAQLEPEREGPLHDYVRGNSVLKHTPSPTVRFVMPLDGEEFPGFLAADIINWEVDPSKATSAATQFANGYQERNIGHSHIWVFNMESGQQVRFTGANSLLYDTNSGHYVSQTFTLPPGTYKAFVQLQNHDHTAAIPATAPTFPGIDSVIFTVSAP